MVSEKENNELQETPTLAGIKGQSSYNTPEGYFESLKAKVLAKSSSKGQVISIKNYWRTIGSSAAATIALVIGFGLYNGTSPASDNAVTVNNTIDQFNPHEQLIAENTFYQVKEENDHVINAEPEEIANYIALEVIEEIDEEDLILALTIEDFNQETEIESTNEIIEYLILEGVDLDLIISEL